MTTAFNDPHLAGFTEDALADRTDRLCVALERRITHTAQCLDLADDPRLSASDRRRARRLADRSRHTAEVFAFELDRIERDT